MTKEQFIKEGFNIVETTELPQLNNLEALHASIQKTTLTSQKTGLFSIFVKVKYFFCSFYWVFFAFQYIFLNFFITGIYSIPYIFF